MLNELFAALRGAEHAQLGIISRHPDIHDGRKTPTMLVNINEEGNIVSVYPMPKEVMPWTLRDGNHNSFPFVQPKNPVWKINNEPTGDIKEVLKPRFNDMDLFFKINKQMRINSNFYGWASIGYLTRLKERSSQLKSLENSNADTVFLTLIRLIKLLEKEDAESQFIDSITNHLLNGLKQNAQDDWMKISKALFLGKWNNGKKSWECNGALLFNVEEAKRPIYHQGYINDVSSALNNARQNLTYGVCALTGETKPIVADTFSQPTLPVLGQTYLFAKNKDIPSAERYGRAAASSFSLSEDMDQCLAALLSSLTSDERKNITWKSIPSEKAKQTDLFIAYVDGIFEEPIAQILGDDDFSEESEHGAESIINTVAVFEKRTERIMHALEARSGADFRNTPVRTMLLRKVDTGNRKVVYSNSLSVDNLYKAAQKWIEAERNVPNNISLHHLSPLSLTRIHVIKFEKKEKKKNEYAGIPAKEGLSLFLSHTIKAQIITRILRLFLLRQAPFLSEYVNGNGKNDSRYRNEEMKKEAEKNCVLLGLLLHKMERKKEDYMNDTAFKLGQFLAGLDVIHAGYCADVRGGNVPPSLLGNQYLTMSQKNPKKALASICQRWKPYAGWAVKSMQDRSRTDALCNSTKTEEKNRGWAIRKAWRCFRELSSLAEELNSLLQEKKIDESFKAELLLGYISGLTKKEQDEITENKTEMKEGA